jgi:hypothetical protein
VEEVPDLERGVRGRGVFLKQVKGSRVRAWEGGRRWTYAESDDDTSSFHHMCTPTVLIGYPAPDELELAIYRRAGSIVLNRQPRLTGLELVLKTSGEDALRTLTSPSMLATSNEPPSVDEGTMTEMDGGDCRKRGQTHQFDSLLQ